MGAPSFVVVVVLRLVVGTRLHCGRDHVDEDVWIPATDTPSRHANKRQRIQEIRRITAPYDIKGDIILVSFHVAGVVDEGMTVRS